MSVMCYLSIAISPFFALSTPLSSTHQPPEASWETWGYNCVSLEPPCLSFRCFYLRIGSEPHFNSPCCTLIFPFFHPVFLPLPSCCLLPASSRVPDLLINNCAALSQHFLLLSMFSTLKLMSDRASIFIGLHHSGGATPSCISLSSPPTTSLHHTYSSIPRSLFPPTSALTKKLYGHPIFFS